MYALKNFLKEGFQFYSALLHHSLPHVPEPLLPWERWRIWVLLRIKYLREKLPELFPQSLEITVTTWHDGQLAMNVVNQHIDHVESKWLAILFCILRLGNCHGDLH